MAKCRQCNRKGIFFKVNKDGYCDNCAAEISHQIKIAELKKSCNALQEKLAEIESRTNNASALLDEAMRNAKTEADRRMEEERPRLKAEYEAISQAVNDITIKQAAAEKELASAISRVEKVKPIANSVQYAFDHWISGDCKFATDIISSLKIEDILPGHDLNCLTTKQLRSRYNLLRKKVIEVCTAYESRYTTKANATLYKLMVLALEAELGNILYKLQFGNLEMGKKSVRDLTAKYYAIAVDGNQSIAPTLQRFVGQIESLYIDVVETEYEYYVQRERAREEQRVIKEQMRQEAEDRKRLEKERKKVELEEIKYQVEIDRLTAQMQQAHDAEIEALQARLAQVYAMLNDVGNKKAEIINLQNGKAGTVYIISNVGSFGDNVFKVGMTRRQNPQERVNELGDASVPFPFDVHSFIFSEDAVALEAALHQELNDRRVNKVNLRKEFFNISIDELRTMVERIDPTAPFRTTALAEQYRQSLSIATVPDTMPIDDDLDVS